MSLVRAYLRSMHEIRSLRVGTGERSYYPALQTLLNDIGEQRRPRVLCVQELADQGAGHPDFGLYSAGQLQARSAEPRPGALPERGVIEAKAPHVDVQTITTSRQVVDYWNRYGLVLVTNFRAFQIVGRDQFGHMVRLEEFTLADSDAAFWTLAAQPARLSDALDTRFTEFLIRALLHNATLSQPRDVAWFLASFARDALARLEGSDPASSRPSGTGKASRSARRWRCWCGARNGQTRFLFRRHCRGRDPALLGARQARGIAGAGRRRQWSCLSGSAADAGSRLADDAGGLGGELFRMAIAGGVDANFVSRRKDQPGRLPDRHRPG